MAKDIRGKDAMRFEKAIKQNEKRKASREEIERAKSAYETFGFAKRVS